MLDSAIILAMGLGALILLGEFRAWSRRARVGVRMTMLIESTVHAVDIEGWLKTAVLSLGGCCVGRRPQRQKIARLLIDAGFAGPRALAFFGFLRLFAAVLCLFLGGWLGGALQARLAPLPVMAFAGLAFGAWLPVAALRWLAARHMQRLRTELPIVMSLVVMTTESGSTVDQALRFAAEAATRARMAMTRSLRTLIDEIGKGAAYEEALGRFGEAIGVSEGRDLAALLAQSITAGTQIGEGLHILVADLLEKRVATAREIIGRRTVLISVVLILCFMPALFILIGAPMASSLFHALAHTVKK